MAGILSAKPTAQEVEAYLAKFQVEEHVQQAINSAIRSRTTDPVNHIADFLEARGLEVQARLDAEAAAAAAASAQPPAPPPPAPAEPS